jgi:hypothetical protein
MVLASDYPFMDVFWSMVIFFAWLAWIWIAITCFADIFRRQDIGGWHKAAWCVFIIIIPFLGVLIYLIAQGHHMAERNAKQMADSQAQFDDYVRQAAGSSGGATAEIERANGLLQSGAITQEEFNTIKAKALAAS